MRLGLFLFQPLIRGTEGRRKGAGNWRWVRAEGAFPYLAQRVHGDEGRGTGRVPKRERWAILAVIGGCEGTAAHPKNNSRNGVSRLVPLPKSLADGTGFFVPQCRNTAPSNAFPGDSGGNHERTGLPWLGAITVSTTGLIC